MNDPIKILSNHKVYLRKEIYLFQLNKLLEKCSDNIIIEYDKDYINNANDIYSLTKKIF